MIRPQTLFRVVAKTTIWLLIVLALFVGLWFVGNRLLDESPHKGRTAFLVSPDDEIPDDQNIAVGMLGLTAPKGSDVLEYGSKIADFYRNNASYTQIEEMMRGPGTLQLTVDSEQVWCWLDPYGTKSDDCLPFEQAPPILEDNAELLERFRSLHQLSQYSNLYAFFNREMLIVLRLAVADIYVDLERGEYETAYGKWRDQLLFAKSILRGADSWVGKAVGLVTFGFTLPLLENIILANPELARKHRAELLSLLQIEGIDAFNPEGIFRAEYSILKQSLETPPSDSEGWSRDRLQWLTYYLGQEQRILNRYFAFAEDYAKALRQPWSQIDEEMSRLKEKHILSSLWDALIDPFGTLYLWVYIHGQLKARELLTSMHVADGRLRLASLFIRIVNADMKDMTIPDFIEAAGPAYHDPFSKGPMKWDPEKRRIYFPDQQNQCRVHEFFRIPDSNSRKLIRMSRADASLC